MEQSLSASIINIINDDLKGKSVLKRIKYYQVRRMTSRRRSVPEHMQVEVETAVERTVAILASEL